MTVDEELSVINDLIDEYGQTNITRPEYNMIYNKAIEDAYQTVHNAYISGEFCQKPLGCRDDIACEDCLFVEISKELEQLKKGGKND